VKKRKDIKKIDLPAPQPAGQSLLWQWATDYRVRFCVAFTVLLGGLMWTFVGYTDFFSTYYLWPISWAAAKVISTLGIPVVAYGSLKQADLYILEIGRFAFHVEHQCSGISAFFIYFAAIAAYPAVVPHKVRGLLLSIPAFFIYGAIRLVVLGVIAIVIPDLLRFFHLYFMVILNIGFVMMLWTDWIRQADVVSG
jgi:exosortase/archaeosortase family protein